MKTCRKCGAEKDRAEFNKFAKAADGLQSYCRSCQKSVNSDRYVPENRKAHHLWKTFGLTMAAYLTLLTNCNNTCPICAVPFTEEIHGGSSPVVDHNHETGKVRGVICRTCNMGLGLFKDSPAVIQNAIIYLNDHGHYGPKEA